MTTEERKPITKMTRKEFLAVPSRENWKEIVECDSVVFIPTGKKHESGYRCMIAVACKDGYPLCRVTSTSDRIDLVGFDYMAERLSLTHKNVVESWRIECLPTSRLLNIWTRGTVRAGVDSSTMDIFGYPQENR